MISFLRKFIDIDFVFCFAFFIHQLRKEWENNSYYKPQKKKKKKTFAYLSRKCDFLCFLNFYMLIYH